MFITVPISYTQAVLGDEIDVPTITGKATLKIPVGTDSETLFRMKEKGIPHLQHQGSGDQYVKVQISVPKKVTKKIKEALKQLKEEKPYKNFFKKVLGI